MCRCWSGFRTPIKWYQNKLLSSHLQAVEEQNTTNKATFAKSTLSDAFYLLYMLKMDKKDPFKMILTPLRSKAH